MPDNCYDTVIEQGATWERILTWKDSAGTAINNTGMTARMHLRRSYEDAVESYALTTENGRIVLGGANGKITLTISATDTATMTGVYLYDLEIVNGAVVTRLMKGSLSVSLEATK